MRGINMSDDTATTKLKTLGPLSTLQCIAMSKKKYTSVIAVMAQSGGRAWMAKVEA